jgi:Ran GTPase-activating protein (RanGAP) involved in mRNA processing and transport
MTTIRQIVVENATLELVLDSLARFHKETANANESIEVTCTNTLAADDVSRLVDFLKSSQTPVVILRLRKNNLSCAEEIAHLISRKSLIRHLDLEENKLGDRIDIMVDALTSNECRLTTLNLNHNKIGPKGATSLARLIRNNTSLHTLSLAHNSLGTKTIKSLSNSLLENTTLRHLDLGFNNISDRGITYLASAFSSTLSCALQSLDLSYNKIGPAGANSLARALVESRNKTLQELNLSLNRIGPQGAEALTALLKYSHTIQVLHLGRNNIGDGVFPLLQGLQENDSSVLKELDLSWNSLTNDAAVSCANVLRVNASLQKLNVSSNAIGTAGVIALAHALIANLSLQELNIVGNQAQDESAIVLARTLTQPACVLQTLLWEKNNFTLIGAARIQGALRLRTSLQTWMRPLLRDIETRRFIGLDLTQNDFAAVGDEELIAVGAHVAKFQPQVSVCIINGSLLSNWGISTFAKEVLATNQGQIDRLYLDGCASLGHEGVGDLAQAVFSNVSLRLLSLTGCGISPEGAKKLANALSRNHTLIRITLSNNRIGDKGFRDIVDAILDPPHPSIKSLNVSNNHITDQGLVLLPTFNVLEELVANKNSITDKGALDIAKACIGSKPTLRWLGLSHNMISKRGIQALKLFLPSTTILDADEQGT